MQPRGRCNARGRHTRTRRVFVLGEQSISSSIARRRGAPTVHTVFPSARSICFRRVGRRRRASRNSRIHADKRFEPRCGRRFDAGALPLQSGRTRVGVRQVSECPNRPLVRAVPARRRGCRSDAARDYTPNSIAPYELSPHDLDRIPRR